MSIVRKKETVYLNETEMVVLLKEILGTIADTAETYDLQEAAQNGIDVIDTLSNEEDAFEVSGEITQDKFTIKIKI